MLFYFFCLDQSLGVSLQGKDEIRVTFKLLVIRVVVLTPMVNLRACFCTLSRACFCTLSRACSCDLAAIVHAVDPHSEIDFIISA